MQIQFRFLLLICALAGGEACAQTPKRPLPGGAAATEKAIQPAERAGKSDAMKVCFRCGGSGTRPCAAPGCRDGQVECSGPCLRLTKGEWVHMDVPGNHHKIWQKFRSSDGTYECWATSHLGEVIEMQNGKAVNVGPCKVCRGTTRVKCPTCRGTRLVACNLCEGKQLVPNSWTEFNNPKAKVKPTLIQLKDGRTVFGKIQMRVGSTIYVRTEDGQQMELKTGEILAEKTAE